MPARKRKLSKRREERREFKMPLHVQLRTPNGLSPLAEFIASCGDEVSPEEAVREYQQDWCEHPTKARRLISSKALVSEDEAVYHIACEECGVIMTRKSRPNLAA